MEANRAPRQPSDGTGPGFRLGKRTFEPSDLVVMAIVNRTPDSFFDKGATFAAGRGAARGRARRSRDGAEIIDIGGVKAGPGDPVDAAEELRRTISTVAAVRERFPDVLISIDTWRAEVATEAVQAGADLLNDTWAGADPALAEVAAATGAGLVCSHAGGLAPRTRPHRAAFDDVVDDVVADGHRPGRSGRWIWAYGADGHPHRPGARLRQEHPALAGADPAPGRAGRDRLAGAGRAVQQGLRRRDAGRPGRRAARPARWPRPRSRPGWARRCSGPTR